MADSLRILLIDDNPDDRALVIRELRKEFPGLQVEQITEASGLAQALEAGNFDLVITDYQLHWTDGLKILHAVKGRWPDCPVVMFTGTGSEEIAVEAMKAGLDDYVLKSPKHFVRLPMSVRSALEQIQQRRAAREAESRYRSLFDGVPVGLYRTAPEGQIFDANRALVQMLGYPDRESLLAISAFDLYVNPEERRQWLTLMEREGVVRDFEVQLCCRDGTIIWVEESARTVRDADGRVLYYEGSLQDITARRRAEEALREANEFSDSLIASMQDGLSVLDSRGVHLDVNSAFCQMTGFSREELIGVGPPHPYWPLEAYEEIERAFQKTLRGEFDDFELTFMRKTGERFPVIVSPSWIKDKQGNVMSYFATVKEITARKRMEEALAVERERLAVTLRSIGEGVIAVDATGCIVLANLAGQEYLKLLAGAEVGDALTHLAERPFKELLGSPPAGQVCHEVVLEGPPRRIFEVAAHPVEVGPEAGGWVLVVREVTRERDIRQRVEAQERLASVGQLAAGIAHDFNNLLQGMMGYTELLEGRPDMPGAAKPYLRSIYQQGARAAKMIRQILDFSRRSFYLQRRAIDLVPLMNETVKLMWQTVPENIEIRLEMGLRECVVNADLVQIQQVLTNLAVNARDAMPSGGTLRVSLSRWTLEPGERAPFPEMSPGEWVLLKMSDTGTGIPPDILPRIFEPFFTTKEPGEGTGLGLAQVYGIVKQHDGFIDVETAIGKGTTFIIYLPAVVMEEEPVEEVLPEVARGSGETILLVEDEELVLSVAQAMLEELGYRVLTARNGLEALVVYEQHRDEVVLVVTDMVMPKMGGLELVQALRDRGSQVKAVGLSGYPLAVGWESIKSEDFMAYVSKPLQLRELAEVVRKAVRGELGVRD